MLHPVVKKAIVPDFLKSGRKHMHKVTPYKVGATTVKKPIQKFLVTVNEWIQSMRYSKHHVKIRCFNYLSSAFINPYFLQNGLAVRTVTVTAGIIMNLSVSAVRAPAKVKTEFSGLTFKNGISCLCLSIGLKISFITVFLGNC